MKITIDVPEGDYCNGCNYTYTYPPNTLPCILKCRIFGKRLIGFHNKRGNHNWHKCKECIEACARENNE